jgi:DNA-binding transcriptional MerR regulator
MEKSRDAFRTISEVAGWLDVPTHVLRFWESRFSHIKPVKRAGGRRYYRPSDMALIGGIKTLLHDEGMTIRGVQKMLREQGVKHVSGFSPPLHSDEPAEAADNVIEAVAVDVRRSTSLPSPAARATHGAEPAPLPQTDEADVQPDMFPEELAASKTEAPSFEHRAELGPHDAPQRTIPDTPDVPEADPLDDAPQFAARSSVRSRLLRMPKRELARHADEIRPVADRLRDLRRRMAE